MSTGNAKVKEATPLEEVSGKLSSDPEEKRLMRSVLENDEEVIKDGKLITAALNSGISAFTPDMMFEKIVSNYKNAKKIYGESFLQEVSGYSESQIERNSHINEFRQELRRRIKDRLERLKEKGLVGRDGSIAEKGAKLSKLVLCTEELDKLASKGLLGEREERQTHSYGLRDDTKPFRKDRYRDIAVRRSVRLAVRRGRREIRKQDLVVFERKSKGKRNIVYALDASGSMKGQKLVHCKKAGIALAYRAIQEKDKIGLVVFGKEVKKKISPTGDFRKILSEIADVTAREKTNLAATIKEGISLFPEEDATKHLILITDAMPTSGEAPEKDTLEAACLAASMNVTVSIIGINLRREGREMAKQIVEIARGKVFTARNLEEIDSIVLQDYYAA